MAKKNNPKAEKAKRNLEYARIHKKKKKMPGRGGPRFGPRPTGAPAGEGGPAPAPSEGVEGGDVESKGDEA